MVLYTILAERKEDQCLLNQIYAFPSISKFLENVDACDVVLSHCRYYAIMVTMFFTVSVMNNYALNLNIAMPLHMIFRSVSASSNVCPPNSMVKWADCAWGRGRQSYRKSSLGHKVCVESLNRMGKWKVHGLLYSFQV